MLNSSLYLNIFKPCGYFGLKYLVNESQLIQVTHIFTYHILFRIMTEEIIGLVTPESDQFLDEAPWT